MSHIHKVQTQITHGPSLVAALERMGVPFQVGTSLEYNGLRMPGFAGSETRCAAYVSREDLARATGSHHYNGLGFVWNGRGYDLAVDPSDANYKQHGAWVNRLTQEYGRAEIIRFTVENPSYTMEEESLPDGTIRISLNHWEA